MATERVTPSKAPYVEWRCMEISRLEAAEMIACLAAQLAGADKRETNLVVSDDISFVGKYRMTFTVKTGE